MTSVAGDNIKDTTPSTPQVKSSSLESSESTNDSGVMTYFGCTTPRTQDEILARQVICLKADRGANGLRERNNHHRATTAELAQKFGAAAH